MPRPPNLHEGVGHDLLPVDPQQQEGDVWHPRQHRVHEGTLTLTIHAHEIVPKQLLHFVGRAQHKRVLEKRKRPLSVAHPYAVGAVVVDCHRHTLVELVVDKVGQGDWSRHDVGRVNVKPTHETLKLRVFSLHEHRLGLGRHAAQPVARRSESTVALRDEQTRKVEDGHDLCGGGHGLVRLGKVDLVPVAVLGAEETQSDELLEGGDEVLELGERVARVPADEHLVAFDGEARHGVEELGEGLDELGAVEERVLEEDHYVVERHRRVEGALAGKLAAVHAHGVDHHVVDAVLVQGEEVTVGLTHGGYVRRDARVAMLDSSLGLGQHKASVEGLWAAEHHPDHCREVLEAYVLCPADHGC